MSAVSSDGCRMACRHWPSAAQGARATGWAEKLPRSSPYRPVPPSARVLCPVVVLSAGESTLVLQCNSHIYSPPPVHFTSTKLYPPSHIFLPPYPFLFCAFRVLWDRAQHSCQPAPCSCVAPRHGSVRKHTMVHWQILSGDKLRVLCTVLQSFAAEARESNGREPSIVPSR